MPGNSFGTIFRLSTFGESHGPAIGGMLEGCPAGLAIDLEGVQAELARRRPGQSALTTQRKEDDRLEVLSGILDGVTTGSPIGFIIRNSDQKSADYTHLEQAYRPSHADFTYEKKFGLRDHRGGGRSSARETASRVAAGAIARQFLATSNITIQAFVKQVGKIRLEKEHDQLDLEQVYKNDVRCPDAGCASEMDALIRQVASAGDTVGGIIQCVIAGQRSGLGEPVFDKLPALLGHAMLSINAVKGFEIGSGFSAAGMLGSEHNDRFTKNEQNEVVTATNHSGGVQGGISNGMPIVFNVAFKPVSTLMQPQETVNNKGNTVTLEGKGRHDACVLPRAVPIVEAMAALVMADLMLLQRGARL